VYKSTGDYSAGKTLYDFYSAVYDVSDPHFISLREIVLKRKQPRKMFVQCNTNIEGVRVISILNLCADMFIYSQGNRSALTNTQETLKV
jgi:hypothetical protein